MIKVRIGDSEKELRVVDDTWINQQINRRRADNENVCVMVFIREDQLNMTLSTPSCQKGLGNRPPNKHERQVFELWESMGLNRVQFTGSDLISFLKKLKI